MSLYTRAEFAGICRTTTAIITTNINRGKIILFDKKIDSENAINVAFFSKYSKKAEKELKDKNKNTALKDNVQEIYKEVVEKATKIVFKKKLNKEDEKRRKKAKKEAESFMDWEIRKKKADTLLVERKAEKELLQIEKLAGKLIPTDLAFDVIRIHNQTIFATFHNDVDNLASLYCDVLASGDRKLLGEITAKLGKYISDCIKRAEDVAMSKIENAVDKYSETRGRGERK